MKEANQLKLEVLLKEYDHRFDEVKFYIDKYNQRSNYLNILFTIVITLFSIVISNIEKINEQILSQQNTSIFIPLVLLFIILFSIYLSSLQTDSLTMTLLNGTRISNLEKEINKIIGEDLLIWDNSIVTKFHKGKTIYKGWIKPTFLSAFWGTILFILLYVILGAVCYLSARNFFVFFVIIESLLGVFQIIQEKLLFPIGIKYMENCYKR